MHGSTQGLFAEEAAWIHKNEGKRLRFPVLPDGSKLKGLFTKHGLHKHVMPSQRA